MLLTQPCIESAEKWYKNDPNPTSAKYVKDLLDLASKDEKAIEELASLFPADDRRVAFGTAGLRAAMKPGPLGMNDLTVVQTAQGLANYCLQQDNRNKKSEKICAVI